MPVSYSTSTSRRGGSLPPASGPLFSRVIRPEPSYSRSVTRLSPELPTAIFSTIRLGLPKLVNSVSVSASLTLDWGSPAQVVWRIALPALSYSCSITAPLGRSSR